MGEVTVADFQQAWDDFLDNLRKEGHNSVLQYFTRVLVNQEHYWAFAYRTHHTRSNDTNNVSQFDTNLIQ